MHGERPPTGLHVQPNTWSITVHHRDPTNRLLFGRLRAFKPPRDSAASPNEDPAKSCSFPCTDMVHRLTAFVMYVLKADIGRTACIQGSLPLFLSHRSPCIINSARQPHVFDDWDKRATPRSEKSVPRETGCLGGFCRSASESSVRGGLDSLARQAGVSFRGKMDLLMQKNRPYPPQSLQQFDEGKISCL